MIPILYRREETSFTSEGLGRLNDIISCTVTEERNGVFECEFKYPVTGVRYADIIEGRIISVTHDEEQDRQPFVIYRRSAPIDGIVTFNAHHISYELSGIVCAPFEADSIHTALQGLKTYSMTDNRFTFTTNKTSAAKPYKLDHPAPVRSLLGGVEGSILDVYGTGEWDFDNFNCYLYLHRGTDSGVTIRYGKNMINLNQEIDTSGIYDAIVPYWKDADTGMVVSGGVVVGNSTIHYQVPITNENNAILMTDSGDPIEADYESIVATAMDLSGQFETQPTVAELEEYAANYLNNNEPWIPKENIEVDFVSLWQTDEYAQYAQLQRVRLCDTVSVYYPELGVNAVKTKVIKVVWNVLLDRYDSIELGTAKTSLAQLILGEASTEIQELGGSYVTSSRLSEAIQNATQLITGQNGGNIVFHYNQDGTPYEMLIMDTDSEATALNIWRYNAAGWGHSSDGGATYTLAATMDGGIVADYIVTGTLNGEHITVINLTATNVDLTGVFKNISANGKVYVKTGGDGWGVYRSSDDLALGGLGWNSDNNGGPVGAALSCKNTSGVRVAAFGTTVTGNGGTNLYWSNGTLMWEIGNTGAYYTDSSGNDIIGAYVGGNGNGYVRTYYQGGDIANTLGGGHLVIRNDSNVNIVDLGESSNNEGGLWLYDDSGTNRVALNVGSLYFFGSTGRATASIGDEGLGVMNGNSWVASMDRYGLVYGASLTITGSKNRVVKTEDYGDRLLYCYETSSPMFGDVGEGTIGADGKCFVWLDPKFSETIQTSQYQVFIQAYGFGDCVVTERKPDHFVVEGVAGLSFGWEIKAKQKDFTQNRLDTFAMKEDEKTIDYAALAIEHLRTINKERGITTNAEGHFNHAV